VTQNDFATYVNSGLYKGGVNILSGVHGTMEGQMIPDSALFEADVARFGDLAGVTIYNIPNMTPAQITTVLQSPGTTIGGFCSSGICLMPFK
jgi:CheY-specific phosphatase CheX